MTGAQAPTPKRADAAREAVAAAILTYAPASLSPATARFARAAVSQAAPRTPERAKALLYAASRLAAFGEERGLELRAEALLREAVIERFVLAGCPALSAATRRTLRTNLRALAGDRRREPAPASLPRERAKPPYGDEEIAGYLGLAAAQSTEARRMRATALVALGAGAGIVASELRGLRGSDVIRRSGGLLVAVGGRRARAVPVLERFHEPLGAAAAFAGQGYLIGGADPARRNLTDALNAALHSDAALPRLEGGGCGPAGWWSARGRSGSGRSCKPPASAARSGSGIWWRSFARSRRRRRWHCSEGPMEAEAGLERLEAIVDASGVAERIEALLPVGVRPRQLRVRTLLIGMLAAAADGRPAHLSRVHAALLALPEQDRRRLGVIAEWRGGPHQLTYRQVERTFGLIAGALAKEAPDGSPSAALDALLEASVEVCGEPASSSVAVDWTDLEAFSRPPRSDGRCTDPEAAWGHRRGDSPGEADEVFFGYYLQVVTVVKEERGPEVPELVRRIQIASCEVDPPPALVPVLERMAKSGTEVGDVLADSGYAYRRPESWALPLRRLGASLVQDLHPGDRGAQGTHMGAIRASGNLYCPATPAALLELGPLARGATDEETAAHDRKAAELARHKLNPITGYDADGYRRVACPATRGKLRCPLRPGSMELDHTRPEVAEPPEHPPRCCSQRTITVPPQVNAKTAQKHDYPSPEHRRSYARRSAAERAYATVKDPASNDLSRGWCRLMGLTPIALFAATVFVARNLRVADAFAARQAEQERRAACGLPPKRRRRRRQSAADLIGAASAPP